MKKKIVYARNRDVIALKNLMIKKFRQYKMRMAGFEQSVQEVDATIGVKVKEYLGLKVRRLVLKSTGTVKDEIYKEIMNEVQNGYLDFVNSLVANQIKVTVERKIAWKTKTVDMAECTVQKINAMYDAGWRIAMSGKLASDKEVIVFEKPVLPGKEANKKKTKKTPMVIK